MREAFPVRALAEPDTNEFRPNGAVRSRAATVSHAGGSWGRVAEAGDGRLGAARLTDAFRDECLTTGDAGIEGERRDVCACVAAPLEDTTLTPEEFDCGATDVVLGDEAVLAAVCWGGAWGAGSGALLDELADGAAWGEGSGDGPPPAAHAVGTPNPRVNNSTRPTALAAGRA